MAAVLSDSIRINISQKASPLILDLDFSIDSKMFCTKMKKNLRITLSNREVYLKAEKIGGY